MQLVNDVFLLAQEQQAEEHSSLDLILPETAELVWGILSFLVVLFVLNRVAWPAIRKGVEDREKKIQSDLEQAEAAKAEAQKQQDEYKKQLAEARSEANRIIEDARRQAEEVRKDVLAKAEQEAKQVVERAQEQIHAERNRTVVELQSTMADLTIQLAETVVGRELQDEAAQRQLVDNYIEEVTGMSSGNGRSGG